MFPLIWVINVLSDIHNGNILQTGHLVQMIAAGSMWVISPVRMHASHILHSLILILIRNACCAHYYALWTMLIQIIQPLRGCVVVHSIVSWPSVVPLNIFVIFHQIHLKETFTFFICLCNTVIGLRGLHTQHHKSYAFTCTGIVHLGPPHIPLIIMFVIYNRCVSLWIWIILFCQGRQCFN